MCTTSAGSPQSKAFRQLHFGPKLDSNFATLALTRNSPASRHKSALIAPAMTPRRVRTIEFKPEVPVPACPICLENYDLSDPARKPRCLPYCGHVLCEACLIKLLSSSQDNIICHICKAKNSLSSHRTIETFPYSWPIIETLERGPAESSPYATSSPTPSAEEQCGHCANREVSHWCVHHAVRLCAYCAFAHGKECRAEKIVEVCDVDKFIRATQLRKLEAAKTIQHGVNLAVEAKEKWLKDVSPKLDAMVQEIQQLKESALVRLDLYIIQLKALLEEVQNAECPEGDLSPMRTSSDNLRPYLKKMSALDDFVKRRSDKFQRAFKLSFSFSEDTYSLTMGMIKRVCALELDSPCFPATATDPVEALHQTCYECGREEIVDYLLKEGKALVNTKDSSGMTSFAISVSRRNPSMYKKLYEQYGADVNVQDNAGKCALIYACMNGDEEAAQYLIRTCKANANVACKWKDTPLHCAVESASLEIVKLLVREGNARVNTPNGRGKLAKDLTSDPAIRQYLLSVC